MKTQTPSNLVGQKLQDLLSVQNLKVGLMFLTSVWRLGGFLYRSVLSSLKSFIMLKGVVLWVNFLLFKSFTPFLHIWFNEYVYIYLVKSSSNINYVIVHYVPQQYFTLFNYNRLYFLFEIFWLEYVKKVNKYHP